jgi:hypothetical protein
MANITQVIRVGNILWKRENPESNFTEPPSMIYESIEKKWDEYYYSNGENLVFSDKELLKYIDN